ncbi:MAG: hypothetical protein QOE96_3765 [Blastocatellia bacterium]|jgi:hypothetical protein|nr:hypothetical protein [Blastocatellia bacterium]
MPQTIVAVKPGLSKAGASGVTRYIAESKRDPEKEQLKDGEARPLFSSELDELNYHQAGQLLGEAFGDRAQSNEVIHLVISLEPEQFESGGDSIQERKDEFKEATRDAGDVIQAEVNAKELRWIAGIHLNTDNPHVHIAISKEGLAADSGKFQRIDHLPRTLLPHHEISPEGQKVFKPGLIAEAVALHFEIVKERRRSEKTISDTREQTLQPGASTREVESPARDDSRGEPATLNQQTERITSPPGRPATGEVPDPHDRHNQQREDTLQSRSEPPPSDTSRPEPRPAHTLKDREVLGRAMVVAGEVERLERDVESLIEHGDKRRFRVFDASHGRTRQISQFDVHRRAEARAAATVRDKEITDPNERQNARNSYYQAEVDQHSKALHDHRIIVAKTLHATQRKLTAATAEHAGLQAQVRAITHQYSKQSKALPTPLLARNELTGLQNQAISNGNPNRVKTIERIRESLAVEHNSPTRTDKEIARLEGQLLMARAEQAVRLVRLQQFEQNKHQTRWQIGDEKHSLVNVDRLIAEKQDESKLFGAKTLHILPGSRRAAAVAAVELRDTRERIFNRIEDRKDELSESLKEAVKMTETLTSIFHRERGNQQERHWQIEQRGETPERLEKELTRSEITRLVEYSLTLADPAMLQQALILESEANARQEEKAPLLEQSAKASGRELLGDISLKDAQQRLTSFNERKDFVPVVVQDLEGREVTARAFDFREPTHPITWLASRLLESKNDQHLRQEVNKAVQFQGEQLQHDATNFEACHQLLSTTAEQLRAEEKNAGHEPPEATFTTKQIVQLEIYALRQPDPNERDRVMSLISHAEETHHVFTPQAFDSPTVAETLLRDTPLDHDPSTPITEFLIAPSPAHPEPSLKQDELSPSLDQTFDIDLTL